MSNDVVTVVSSSIREALFNKGFTCANRRIFTKWSSQGRDVPYLHLTVNFFGGDFASVTNHTTDEVVEGWADHILYQLGIEVPTEGL